jgi:hypothetical protein
VNVGPGPTDAYQQYELSLIQGQFDLEYEFAEATKMAAGAQARLQQDVNVVEQANATIRERNARLVDALRRVAGTDLGDDREAWLKWYMSPPGYTYTPPKDRPKQTLDVEVPLPYVPQRGPRTVGDRDGPGGGGGGSTGWCMIWEHLKNRPPRSGSCFAAGTPVLTPDGRQAIETLRAGE